VPGFGLGTTGDRRFGFAQCHGTPIAFPEDESFDIGQDTRSGVALLEYRYDVPFKFTGTIDKLTFNLGPDQVTAEEREETRKTVARTRD
jgi:hypothetical protein